MQKLSTIQQFRKLNEVYRAGEPGPGSAYHNYVIAKAEKKDEENPIIAMVRFQKGPRQDPESISGVLDVDLLEIVRDRLTAFQSGELATEHNAEALSHVEAALVCLNQRVEDRIKRGVLGTMEK